MMKIGLAPNPLKAEAIELAARLAEWLVSRGIGVVMEHGVAQAIGRSELGAEEDAVAETELLVVIGGDGSLLRWNRIAAPKGTPMMGVNLGQYGFITEINPDDAQTAIETFFNGKSAISERAVLKATIGKGDTRLGTFYALNDVVVSKGPLARMIQLDTYVNGKFIVTHSADGIIVASPTGSTAYSLSAGGPIVNPDVSVLVITPVCSHTLAARSLVIPDTEKIKIVGPCEPDGKHMMLTIDGQLGEDLVGCNSVEIEMAEFKAKLVQAEPDSFYTKLQTRLRWGKR